MKKLTALAATALFTLTVQGTAHAQMAGFQGVKATGATTGRQLVQKTKGRHRGRIAAGIALGLLGAAAIAHSARAYERDHYESRHERRCNRWMYRCEDGDYRSCRKFDRRC